jgi:hypothetical protein
MMRPRLRKFVLTVHVVSSVSLLGAVAAFLALAIVGLTSHDAETVRAVYLAMNLLTKFVIVPLMFASLLVGIVESLGTPWGLFRYYWVLVKLVLTLFATIVLLIQMDPIGFLARAASDTTLTSADLGLQVRLLIHSAGGLIVLLILVVLSLYKPRGVTGYGARKLRDQRTVLVP